MQQCLLFSLNVAERPIQNDSAVFSVEWAFSVSHDKHDTGLMHKFQVLFCNNVCYFLLMSWSGPSGEKVKSSVLNGLSQYLMTNTILDSIFDQPKSKPPQPSTLLTENHSLPSANTTTKPQTHSLKTTLFPI